MGDGTINAGLFSNGSLVSSDNHYLSVDSFSEIPAKNSRRLHYKGRLKDAVYKIIILNDSSKSEFVKHMDLDFGYGKVTVVGSKYLSKNPYFSVKPMLTSIKPVVKIELSKQLL